MIVANTERDGRERKSEVAAAKRVETSERPRLEVCDEMSPDGEGQA